MASLAQQHPINNLNKIIEHQCFCNCSELHRVIWKWRLILNSTMITQTLCGYFMACIVPVGLPVSFEDRRVEEFKKEFYKPSQWVIQTPSYSLKNVICSTSLFSCLFSVELCDVFDSYEPRFKLPLGIYVLYLMDDIWGKGKVAPLPP